MSMFRRRLLMVAAINNGLPNSPIRFKDGKTAVFKDGKHGYFALDYEIVRSKGGGRIYFKDRRRMGVVKKK